ncbi:FAD-dependent monooxygenase [Spongiactinospora sp. TRM90649]|uniref:FAD-dependent oxidoreductase n=1 Tax=Spongiactinospora sp. TRM90649 TaxID=3031114 RepID=UPI0023F97A4A|nr:FAD-dependent monooxygenase [Spongiactinospora sp. TRM90649]MDF5758854.1 FAD-dependent monooxygenase [Spongiactinospora sp. TRM90649]
MRVIVIGAGLGGLTLAHGLRGAGIDVAVYERDAERGRPQGVSLHLDDRGTSALRACLPPGHAEMVAATSGGPRDATLLLSEVDGELAVTGTRPADGTVRRPGQPVNRRLLRSVLLTELEDVVRFGAAFTGYERRPDGTVRAWFADGGTDTADVLVGADGVGSAVRRQYLPQMSVADTGRRMLMGATPLRAVAGSGPPELIGDSAANVRMNGMTMVLGPHRFTHPPLAARARWLPALPAEAVAGAEDHLMWCLPVTRERLGSAGALATVWHLARELAVDLHPALRMVVEEAWPQVTVALRIGMIPPVPAWPASAVTVIGDAVHAAPGFGGNLAMRDAHRLRDALVSADQGERDLLAAIGAAEERMRQEGVPAMDADGRAVPGDARIGVAGPGA